MDSLGLDAASLVEGDLALSEDEVSIDVDDWPELRPKAPKTSLSPHHASQQSAPFSSTKRPADYSSDSNADSEQPHTKLPSVPLLLMICLSLSLLCLLWPPVLPLIPLLDVQLSRPVMSTSSLCLMELRLQTRSCGGYLTSRKHSSCSVTLQRSRWPPSPPGSSTSHDNVRTSSAESRLVIFCHCHSLCKIHQRGHENYPTIYSLATPSMLTQARQRVYSARRFLQDGSPINRIVIVWSLPEPLPSSIYFDFLPCLPACDA